MAGYTTRTDNGEIIFYPEDLIVSVLDADQSVTNSSTVVAVPAFTVPVGIRERYLVRYNIFFSTTAAGDFRYLIDAPASPTLFRQVAWGQAGDNTSLTTPAVITTEATQSLTHSGAEGFLLATVNLVNGANAGNLLFQFAQEAATAAQSAIVRAGSFIEVRKY